MEELKNLSYLLPNTREILQCLVQDSYMSNFVLVDGSALDLHIKHRKSEGFDFFTYKKGVYDVLKIKRIISKLDGKIVNISDEQIDFLLMEQK